MGEFLLKKDGIKDNKGFSLIEMIVALSIFGFIAGVTVVNYRAGERSAILTNSANLLASNIRLAQNYALSSKEDDAGAVPAFGWGIFLAQGADEYYLFKNLADGDWDCTDSCATNQEKIRIFKLPQNIIVNSINPASPGRIVFLPPDPKTYVNGDDTADMTIVLRNTSTNQTKSITVNSYGMIEVQ